MTTVLITGANRGIGLEFVRQYLADGADVIACCRDPDGAAELAALAGEAGGRLKIIKLDVGDDASIEALRPALGETAIDILINNAGISGPRDQSAERIDPAGWLEAMRVNALGPLLMAQALRDNLMRGREKKIVAITSGLGSTAGNSGGRYAYRPSKAALNNAMRGLSRDWAKDGVLVAILHPGWVRTDMGGANAAVAPEESVRGLRRQIAELDAATSGAYRDYRGAEIAW